MGKTKRKGRSKGRGRSGRSPVATRAVTRHREATSARVALRMKSYVYIIGGRIDAAVGRVAQVLAANRDKSMYGVRLNHNGQVMLLKRENLRKATAPERNADKKQHNSNLTFIEEYNLAYPSRQIRL